MRKRNRTSSEACSLVKFTRAVEPFRKRGTIDLSGNLPDSHPMPATKTKPKPTGAKKERLEARVSSDLKRTITRAAHLAGRSVTDFVLESVRKSAHETILEHEVIRLNAEESLAFVKGLLNPPKPNARLRAAFARHRQQVRRE